MLKILSHFAGEEKLRRTIRVCRGIYELNLWFDGLDAQLNDKRLVFNFRTPKSDTFEPSANLEVLIWPENGRTGHISFAYQGIEISDDAPKNQEAKIVQVTDLFWDTSPWQQSQKNIDSAVYKTMELETKVIAAFQQDDLVVVCPELGSVEYVVVLPTNDRVLFNKRMQMVGVSFFNTKNFLTSVDASKYIEIDVTQNVPIDITER